MTDDTKKAARTRRREDFACYSCAEGSYFGRRLPVGQFSRHPFRVRLLTFSDLSLDAARNVVLGRCLIHRNTMSTIGTVKFFNATKGFGFIAPQDGSKDVFVHISAVERAGLTTLAVNQQLSFDLERGNNGKISAANLKVL